MKYLISIAVFLFRVLNVVAGADDSGGFIFTAPKRFLSGTDELVCIVFRNISESIGVQVVIRDQKDNEEISSANELISENDGKCFTLSIPKSKTKKGRLLLSISRSLDYNINYSEQISIQSPPEVVFIVTDKPVYSGGHVVKFKIFIINLDLTHVVETVDKIWIENPNGVHLAQWLNESTSKGFIEKTFRLTDEPLTGLWNVKVKRKYDDVSSYGFRVENYVLPKFSISLNAPKTINSSADFNVIVCARYLFGEPVHGTSEVQLQIKCSFAFYCQGNISALKEESKLDSEGCATHRFRISNVSNFAQKIILNATVRESGTDIEAGAVTGIEIKDHFRSTALEFSTSTKVKRFKLGLPFKGQIIDKNEFDSDVILCLDVTGKTKCTSVRLIQGKANFVLTPTTINSQENFTVSLQAKYADDVQKIVKLTLVPWYSPSGSYIQLEDNSNGILKCNRNATFNLFYTYSYASGPRQFRYVVKSRGRIIKEGLLDADLTNVNNFNSDTDVFILGDGDFSRVMQFKFTLNVTTQYSPSSLLLVYYITPDGEVVADTLTFNVAKCLKTPVITRWHRNISLPGDGNKFEINTTPNTVCALSVTDRSTKFLVKNLEFNKDTVFRSLQRFDSEPDHVNFQTNRCRNDTDSKPQHERFLLPYPETDSRFVDSQQAFEDFGALVITDLNLQTRPCKEEFRTEKSMGAKSRNWIKTYGMGNEADNMIQPKRADLIKILSKQRENSLGFELRNFFPETWIWNTINVGPSGKAELEVVVPHTITEWDSETICLSEETGIGVSDIKRMTTYQPFFLDFVVPRTVKRKEIFHLSVSVFNYEEQDLPIKITYSPSEKFTSKSKNYHSYCVKSKSKVVHRFILEPVMLGEAVVTVMGEVDLSFDGNCGSFEKVTRDTVSKNMFIKHEGFPVHDVKSGFICGDNKNFENEISWTMKIPPDIVESSLSAGAFVCGDILGPSLKNVDHLVMLPTGCGEQNMIMLAPNILILEYLLLTKPEETELIERALKNLDLGYQKQLNYRHGDGSYSAFGEKDEKGSIWLTSFVVRYISQARKFIHIDNEDLNVSVNWILKHQLENGCFPVIGKIYHRDLKGKFFENDSSKALTAYIIVSLLESGLVSKNTTSMKNAIYCLKGIEQSSGTYGDLLTTYALLMVGEIREAQALMFELLKGASRAYGQLWWENENSSTESSVEMTAYGILCLLKLGGSHFTAAASDAVKWITQYRNKNGGFISSQDTTLALEAISKLSASLPRLSASDNLMIHLGTGNRNFSFEVSKQNELLLQEQKLPSYLSDVKFSATGKGCSLVQTYLKYNIRHGIQNNQLKIQLKIDSVSDTDLYFVTKFSICARHKSATDTIKMAVMEVFMVSGFYPDRTTLYGIPISRKGVRKWEEYEEKIVFYFEDLKQKKVCVQFLVNQEACVEKTSPALIKLYDYYNNHHITTVKYSLQPECYNDTGNWLNLSPEETKTETKREISKDYFSPIPSRSSDSAMHLDHFLDVSYDMEVPKEIGTLPIYVPYRSGGTCPKCSSQLPSVFSNLYCSARNVFKVNFRSENVLDIMSETTPTKNEIPRFQTITYTIDKNCSCDVLNKVKSSALIILTWPREREIAAVDTIHLDNSTVVILWHDTIEYDNYLKEAKDYCKQWH